MSATTSALPQPAGPRPRGLRGRRIPPNVFAICFGLAGLAEAWEAAGPVLRVPEAIADALFILAAAVWTILITAYAAQGARRLRADLRDTVLGPFLSLSVITPMILATALSRTAFTAGQVLVVVFLVLTLVLGGWMTGHWMTGQLKDDSLHPGYLLPTVAGGLVGGGAAAGVHLHAVGVAAFGIGMLCWLLIGSMLLNRLFTRPLPPPPLIPTLAIEFAPPVVAGVAYFALTGGSVNLFATALGGYAVLMTLVQFRLLPVYTRLRFSPGFWAFTFPYAAGATDALLWIHATRPAGSTAYAVAAIALVTILISAIAARTVVALTRGQFFPPAAPAAASGPPAGAQSSVPPQATPVADSPVLPATDRTDGPR